MGGSVRDRGFMDHLWVESNLNYWPHLIKNLHIYRDNDMDRNENIEELRKFPNKEMKFQEMPIFQHGRHYFWDIGNPKNCPHKMSKCRCYNKRNKK